MVPGDTQQWIYAQLLATGYQEPQQCFTEVIQVLTEFDWLKPRVDVIGGVPLLVLYGPSTELPVPKGYPTEKLAIKGLNMSLRGAVVGPLPVPPKVPSKVPVSPARPPLPSKEPLPVQRTVSVQSSMGHYGPVSVPVHVPFQPPVPVKQLPNYGPTSHAANYAPNYAPTNYATNYAPPNAPTNYATKPAPTSHDPPNHATNHATTHTTNHSPPNHAPDLMDNIPQESSNDELVSKLESMHISYQLPDTSRLQQIEWELKKSESALLETKQQLRANIRSQQQFITETEERISKLPAQPPTLDELVTVKNPEIEKISADDKAIDSLLNLLPKALDSGALSLPVYLRLVRQHARNQFECRSKLRPPKTV